MHYEIWPFGFEEISMLITMLDPPTDGPRTLLEQPVEAIVLILKTTQVYDFFSNV